MAVVGLALVAVLLWVGLYAYTDTAPFSLGTP